MSRSGGSGRILRDLLFQTVLQHKNA